MATFPDLSPVDGAVDLRKFCEADAAAVESAVRAARAAQLAGWRYTTPAESADWLHKIADGIQARFDDFVEAEVADTGRPVSQARTLDIARGIANFRTSRRSGPHGTAASSSRRARGRWLRELNVNYVTRKPLGVVGIISPWNLPLLLFTWKVAPALAMSGNCVVAKPSRKSVDARLRDTACRSACHDIRFVPLWRVQSDYGHGPNAAGEFLARHPDISAELFLPANRVPAARS